MCGAGVPALTASSKGISRAPRRVDRFQFVWHCCTCFITNPPANGYFLQLAHGSCPSSRQLGRPTPPRHSSFNLELRTLNQPMLKFVNAHIFHAGHFPLASTESMVRFNASIISRHSYTSTPTSTSSATNIRAIRVYGL